MSTPIVVMGVSGCGKSTLARDLANRIGRTFIEGDDCHPPANVAKMSAGISLTDDDRRPFLEKVSAALLAAEGGGVASCSALRRRYRDLIRMRCGHVLFVLPIVPYGDLVGRMLGRDHFMPASLLDSQLATLELPTPDEFAVLIDGLMDTPSQVRAVLSAVPDLGIGSLRKPDGYTDMQCSYHE
ncbi:gluconokinase [Phenylobacterium montanum]|uniref:Gluconokinase n=1 Tax=Phenylobacterium montanum TaxID=2823693 RepID=A0A975IWT5_9CAUL|nr:gluconokinase [Caulobacter sp. S6]QUD90228.1 gluconokinase [Caulobacter sp. S6]